MNGRYAFCAICVKHIIPENNQNSQERKSAIVQIKVYDTFSGAVIQNLDKACRLGKEIHNYSSVLKAHPQNEHQFLSCCDGGITVLYDVKRLEVVQEIQEYATYSIESYCMNNAVDVDFSSDGQYIALSSIYGTITVYTTNEQNLARYEGTRVQQFFAYDN